MTHPEFLERLSKLDAEDSGGLTALAQDLIREGREIPSFTVQLYRQVDSDPSKKAMVLLGEIQEFGIVPLLDLAAEPPSSGLTPERALWVLRTVGANLLELQRHVVRSIDKALDDRRQTPTSKAEPALEEQPPPVRVCDEAYLQMRRVLNVEEGDDQYFLQARAFLNLGNVQKDAEILKARKMRVWSRIVGGKQTES
jgi:hypothetical protein